MDILLAEIGRWGVGSDMTDAATIYVIDDDESMRGVLSSLLRSVGYQALTYPSVAGFLAAKRSDKLSCLLLDVRLPGTSGLDFQAQLAGLDIHLPVVLMTGHGDIPMSVRGMKAGAVDFLTKPFRDQDLLDAVSAALERDRLRRKVAAGKKDLQDKFDLLSLREQEIVRLVTAGKMNKQVAGILNLSEITVKIHRGSAMRKMGARTLADLVKMAEALRLDGSK
jgi:FixJ family two-component response regulator